MTRDEHSLPAIHALHLAELVKRWGVTPAALFAELPVDRDRLADPAARIDVPTVVEIVQRARALTKEPALGYLLGAQMRVSAYGFLGFAAMSASTVGEALALATRYAPMITTALSLRLDVAEADAILTIDERADFGPARDAVILAIVVGIWQIGNALSGTTLTGKVDFAFPVPRYALRLAELAPEVAPNVRFGAKANRMIFDAAALKRPLVLADPSATRLATEQCERALESMRKDAEIVLRVRELLPHGDRGFRSLDEVAAALHVSPRTLKRRLAAHGAAFTEVLAEAQKERATSLLRATSLTIDEVAERVGYSDVANFTRAFRRWTGATPAAFRRGGA